MNINTMRCHHKVPEKEIPNMENIEGKKIIFLDFDGVVNTLRIEDGAKNLHPSYGYPNDNKVNDTQAVRWLLLFCRENDYYIIVTSTWRLHDNYKECLINAGFEDGYRILGALPDGDRWEEIDKIVNENHLNDLYLVIDDDSPKSWLDENGHFDGWKRVHYITCNSYNGFHADEFFMATDAYTHLVKHSKNEDEEDGEG